MVSTVSTKTKAYAFGLATKNGQSLTSLAPYKGKVLANQDVNKAAYQENVGDFSTAFVYEFPSLTTAIEWQSHRGTNGEDGLTVILETEEFGGDYVRLKNSLRNLNVLGGCCGTDQRHVREAATACAPLFGLGTSGSD